MATIYKIQVTLDAWEYDKIVVHEAGWDPEPECYNFTEIYANDHGYWRNFSDAEAIYRELFDVLETYAADKLEVTPERPPAHAYQMEGFE